MCSGGRGQSELLPPYNPHHPLQPAGVCEPPRGGSHRVSDCLGRKRPASSSLWPGCPLARVPGSPGRVLLPLLPLAAPFAAALLRQRSGNLLFLVPTLGRKRSGEGNLQACSCGWAHCPGAGSRAPWSQAPRPSCPLPAGSGSIPGMAAGWGWGLAFAHPFRDHLTGALAKGWHWPRTEEGAGQGETACLAAHGRQQLGFSGAS